MILMTIEEAASFMHMHKDTLSEMAKARKVPCAKPGKRYIFIKEDLIEWIRGQYSGGPSEEEKSCPSSKEVASGGLTSVTPASVSERLRELKTRKRR